MVPQYCQNSNVSKNKLKGKAGVKIIKLEGKPVAVTGISSGMGKAIVELLVEEGANVVTAARRWERRQILCVGAQDLVTV